MKKDEKIRGKFYYRVLITSLVLLIILALLFIVFRGEDKKENDLGGELSSLKWSSEGINVILEKNEKGEIILSLKSNLADAYRAISKIQLGVLDLIRNLKDNGAPVDASSFSLNFFENENLLELKFDERVGETILRGALLFLNQSAEYCNIDLINNLEDKIESEEVYMINLTTGNCGVSDIPSVLSIINLATIYENNTSNTLSGLENVSSSEENQTEGNLEVDNVSSSGENQIEGNINNSQNVESYEDSKKNSQIIIINPYPRKSPISIFKGDIKNFSIGNNDYSLIKWELEGKNVKIGENFYEFKREELGEYILKVEIQKEELSASKIWVIYVKDLEKEIAKIEDSVLDCGEIIFYLIILMIIFIILILSWMFIKDKLKSKT